VSLIERKVKYSWEDKLLVASKFQQLGNARLVSELTGVPYQTILDWRKTDWWIELMDELKQIKRSKSGAKLAEIIEVGTDIIMDRLTNGDIVLNNKTGELTRKQVSLRDAAQAVNNLITRQIQMEELAEKLVHRKESIQETLKLLSKEFAKFSKEQQKLQAQDIKFKELPNAIHDEREEGLQEGSGEVYEQASGEEEEGGAERSQTEHDPERVSSEG
jgi:hypothetical protein